MAKRWQNEHKKRGATREGDHIVYEHYGVTEAVYYRGLNLVAQKIDGYISHYLYDQKGSVTGGANRTGTTEYDAFGVQRTSDKLPYNPFRYNGEYYDQESGLIYLRNRYYDPATGRFLTEDPAKDGLNWYVYCGGNPVNFADPLGLEYVVISGSEYDEGRWKYNFVETAIKKLRELKDLDDREGITWIVNSTDYSEDALQEMDDIAYELGVGFVTIESAAELQNYMNSKDKHNWYYSDDRAEDPIRKVAVFSHGTIGFVELGYNQSNRKALQLDYYWTRGLDSRAFDNPNSAFYSCNTGTDQTGWGTNFAQAWVNKTGGRTWAARGRTDYGNIMNDFLSNKWSREPLFSRRGSDNYPVASNGVQWMNFYPYNGG